MSPGFLENCARLLAAALIMASVVAVPAGAVRAQDDDEPLEYIFQIIMPPIWQISEAMFAYEDDGKYYLPIRALSRDFEFYVDIEPKNRYAAGFAASEENSFVIDGIRNELTIKGQRETLNTGDILSSDVIQTDDVYVELGLLNRIWPVEMQIELSKLAIMVESEADLPFERKRKREGMREIIEGRKDIEQKRREYLPFVENNYLWLGKPIIDIQHVSTYDKSAETYVSNNTFSGKQQIGKMLADYSATLNYADGSFIKPESVRLKLERSAVEDEYLIIPGVRRFEAGDVNLRQRQLISNSEGGRGFIFSNDARDRQTEFDRITIEGTGPPGWEIELYNNNELIEFGVVPDDGEYIFEDVVLNFGNNQIKKIFFGPQGQVREEVENYRASGSMLSPGDFKYNAGFVDSNRPLILLDNDPRTTPRGTTRTGHVAYGLNNSTTVFGNYTYIPGITEDMEYVTAGAAFSLPIGLAEAEIYSQIGGGNAYDTSLITSLLGFRLNLNASLFRDFESDEAGFGAARKKFETEVLANRSFNIFGRPIGLRINALHTEFENSLNRTTFEVTETMNRAGLRLTHTNTFDLEDGEGVLTTGGVSVTWRDDPWQLRGALNYETYPETDLSTGSAEIRYQANDRLQTALNVSHNFPNSIYTIGAQIGYDFQKALASLKAEYEREKGWEFVLRATTSLHPYTPDGSYDLSSRSHRNYAPVRARVFLDNDLDGAFSEGDEPLPETHLMMGYAHSNESTNEDGFIIAPGPRGRKINVQVDKATLIDPYYIPVGGISVVPVEGKVFDASFPVVESGAVEGTVYSASSGRATPGLPLRLLDSEGELVMVSETGFDGYYAFEFVQPGTYTISPDESYGLKLDNSVIEVTPDELFLYGHDMNLQDQGIASRESYDMQEDGAVFDEDEPLEMAESTPVEEVSEEPEDFDNFAVEAMQEEGVDPEEYSEDMIVEYVSPEDLSPENFPDEYSDEGIDPEEYSEDMIVENVEPDDMPDIDMSEDDEEQLMADMEGEFGTSISLSRVTDARMVAMDDKARLVLKMTGAPNYEVYEGSDGKSVVIDLKATTWGALPGLDLAGNDNIKGFSADLISGERTRVVVYGNDAVSVANKMSVPEEDGSYYFLIDLY